MSMTAGKTKSRAQSGTQPSPSPHTIKVLPQHNQPGPQKPETTQRQLLHKHMIGKQKVDVKPPLYEHFKGGRYGQGQPP